jgi:hypothetical protein
MTPTVVALLVAGSCALMIALDRIVARQNRRAERHLDAAWDAVTRDVNRRVREDREAWQRESRRDGWPG